MSKTAAIKHLSEFSKKQSEEIGRLTTENEKLQAIIKKQAPEELWTDIPGRPINIELHNFNRRHKVGQPLISDSIKYTVTKDKLVEYVWLSAEK